MALWVYLIVSQKKVPWGGILRSLYCSVGGGAFALRFCFFTERKDKGKDKNNSRNKSSGVYREGLTNI